MAKRDPALLLAHEASTTDGIAPSVGWSTFKHIIILGDSYSSDTKTNWVGHLLRKYPAGSRPVVDNFATAGDTVEDDLATQLERLYAERPNVDALDTDSDKVLLVIWLGINDCGGRAAEDLEPIVKQLFDAMHDLYVKWKAQSFLFIDVPPMHRSPAGREIEQDDNRYTTWNSGLLAQTNTFAKEASKASVYVISSYSILSDILDNPKQYGLSDSVSGSNDEEEEDEAIDLEGDGEQPMWEDDIHLSKAGHLELANRLWETFRV